MKLKRYSDRLYVYNLFIMTIVLINAIITWNLPFNLTRTICMTILLITQIFVIREMISALDKRSMFLAWETYIRCQLRLQKPFMDFDVEKEVKEIKDQVREII